MYAKTGTEFRHKNCADVRLNLVGEPPVNAVVYLAIGQRLTDLLNDNRAFIPIRKENGQMMIVAKSQIAAILEQDVIKKNKEKDGESFSDKRLIGRRPFDPYAMLRVTKDASLDDIRAAYKERIKAVHPDTIAALDLDGDLAKAALLSAQKVNYAYQKILREREAAETPPD